MYDILFKNAWIADGSGKPLYKACVAVKDGRIAKIGEIACDEAEKVIELTEEQVLCPGFFDVHTHNDMMPFFDPNMTPQVLQGVTFDLSGNCGQSMYPVSEKPEYVNMLKKYTGALAPLDHIPVWPQLTTFAKYKAARDSMKPRIRLGNWMGQGSIRIAVMGMDSRRATPEELEKMKAMVREGMENGALGLSTGLLYMPGVFTPEDEIVELAKVAAEYGGVYATHMRDEGNRVVEAVEEAIRIAKASGCKLLISHHKVCGKANAGKQKITLGLMDKARAEGMTVMCDQYPFNYGSTTLAAVFPPKYQTEGNEALLAKVKDPATRELIKRDMETDTSFENTLLTSGPEGILIILGLFDQKYDGKNIAEVAEELGVSPSEAICRVFEDNNGVVLMAQRLCDESIVDEIWLHPFTAGGSDGIGAGYMPKTHPRAYSTFVKIFQDYVRERRIMSLEEAVRRVTSLPAGFLGFKDMGLVKEGNLADLVVFNKNTIGSKASFKDPLVKPTGIDYVFVGGELVVKDEQIVPRQE